MSHSYILSVDQGTSSTKAIVFDADLNIVARASVPLNSMYLAGGFVEQDPEEIYRTVIKSVDQCLREYQSKGLDLADLRTCGLTNQRETFVIWDKSGQPLHNAVVWQCKRSVNVCTRLNKEWLGEIIHSKTGLIIDPYFSGTKLIWLYENSDKVRKAIDAKKACFGTIDTWLLYRLTKEKVYLTDYTNASRTLFFNLKSLTWDDELLGIFGLSRLNLPEPKPSSFAYGQTNFDGLLSSPIPIDSVIGDSHAAAVGEGCFSPGMAKATMGTGSSILMNVGNSLKRSSHGMVSTICWSMEGRVDYAVEGVIVSCGAIIEWLKNQMGLFLDSKETEAMATSVPDNGGVTLLPAFSGLGAPYWRMDLKASINGLTFNSTKNHVVRAALEAISFQVKDIISTLEEDSEITLSKMMVNGGLISNRFLLQQTADLLGISLGRKNTPDVTSQGTACLAGLRSGVFRDIDHLQALTSYHTEIAPERANVQIAEQYCNWKNMVKKAILTDEIQENKSNQIKIQRDM